MFIINPQSVKKTFACKKTLANALINKYKIPLLSYEADSGIFYFSDTDELQDVLSKLSWYLKLLI